MKNILGKTENLELFVLMTKMVKILTHKDSNGYSYEYTYDKNGNKLTYKDSNGVEKGAEEEDFFLLIY